MFIECGYQRCSPPSGGPCLPSRTHTLSWVTDMALLTEGGLCSGEIYKHGPPDGGRTASSWIDSERQITTPMQVSLFNHTQSNVDQIGELGDSSKQRLQFAQLNT